MCARLILPVAVVLIACGRSPAPTAAASESGCRCRPAEPCWPAAAEWDQLAARLRGKLVRAPRMPAPAQNPFALEDEPGGTQSTGWLDAWTAAPSAHAVAAESAADVAEAIEFAARHRLRVAIKGTGHDYLGRSSAPDSLLIWTHAMRDVSLHDAFVPKGCPAATRGLPAVSIGAGTRWLDVYARVTPEHGRYVQGGGCVSVGAAGGFTQGGGFGSWSKAYGTAAASMLEAEVVTADGEIRIANACQHADLFWALRGGGGGTFGVVTRMTLMTHDLPTEFGLIQGKIVARSPAAMRELLEQLVGFARSALLDPHWGEQVRVGTDSLELSIVFQGLSKGEAEAVWKPLRDWVDARPRDYETKIEFLAFPARMMWNHEALARVPGAIQRDDRPGQPPGTFWWANNTDEVSAYWHAYQSRWLPQGAFSRERAADLAATLFDASRHWPLEIHFNKGLAGAAPDALARSRDTAIHPAAHDAAALVIAGSSATGVHPGIAGREPDRVEGERARARVAAAMKIVRAATPDAGTYVNESDYFEPDWQRTFWGDHYPRLLAIKDKYDPQGLFVCHHCVGSERWSPDGMCMAAGR